MRQSKQSFFGFLLTIFIVFNINRVSGQNNPSVLISGKVITRGGMRYGVSIGLRNINTGNVYFSELLSTFRQSHSLIELPRGKYEMFYFQGIPSKVQNTNEDNMNNIRKYFGVLEFRSDRVYYLGNHIGHSSFSSKTSTYYSIENSAVPKKLSKNLKKNGIIKDIDDIIIVYTDKSDTLEIK